MYMGHVRKLPVTWVTGWFSPGTVFLPPLTTDYMRHCVSVLRQKKGRKSKFQIRTPHPVEVQPRQPGGHTVGL